VRTLANGVRVVCDPMPGLQTLALSVVAGRGARIEDAARSGWSHLLEHMVFKGAGGRSARDIVEVIEAEGGHINAATGYERTSFQVRALAGGLDLASRVVADLVQRPTMDAGDLAREIQVVGQEIAEAADTPDDLVFELAQSAAFDGHPLGRPILGAPETIAAATPAALNAWREALYAPESLVVSAAGAVDEGELLRLVERDFGAAQAGAPLPDSPPATFAGGLRPTAKRLEQANIVLLLPAVGARDPDYFALAWPTPSTPIARPTPTPACWGSSRAARPATPPSWPRSRRRRSPASPGRSARPNSPAPRPS
jgi:predicted Zn-dependent peptidase